MTDETAAGVRPRPPRTPPRWVKYTVVPLLVLVPIVYIAISAEQSRDSGQDKAAAAALTRLTRDWPAQVQRRVYQVPIPSESKDVAYLETNSWNRSTLYVQFATTPGGLDTFLAQVGTSRADLKEGAGAIGAEQARKAGWDLGDSAAGTRIRSGVSLTQHGDKPDHDVTVDLTDPARPMVYVVSTVGF